MGEPQLTAPKTLRHTFATMLQDATVDPLIRNELMGHAPGYGGISEIALGMTSVYTHTSLASTDRSRPSPVLGGGLPFHSWYSYGASFRTASLSGRNSVRLFDSSGVNPWYS